MIIKGKRVRSLNRHLGRIGEGERLVFAVPLHDLDAEMLTAIGFGGSPEPGDAVLPTDTFGTVSHYNAEGKELIHKDQKMETVYRQGEWTWTEFHGPYDRIEKSKIVDIPYQRYPRTFVPPPGVELSIQVDSDGNQIVATPSVKHTEENEDQILHSLNLMLEIFGYCVVLSDDFTEIPSSKLRRINWEVLPPGRWSWSRLEEQVEPVIRAASEGNQPVIRHRITTVSHYGPEFVAIGKAGFRGYLIFGFPDRDLYVLESAYTGNATYVFGDDWETLSKRTKAEILAEDLHEARLIHREGWEDQVEDLLG